MAGKNLLGNCMGHLSMGAGPLTLMQFSAVHSSVCVADDSAGPAMSGTINLVLSLTPPPPPYDVPTQPNGTFIYLDKCCDKRCSSRLRYGYDIQEVTVSAGCGFPAVGPGPGFVEMLVTMSADDEPCGLHVEVRSFGVLDVISTFDFPLSGGTQSEVITLASMPFLKDISVTHSVTLSA